MNTYTNLQAQVTYNLGNRTDISTYVSRWVNWAYNDLWNVLDVRNKEATATGTVTSGTSYIAKPAGVGQILRMTVDGKPLERREWREYSDITTFAEAAPTKYYLFSTNIYFDTEPDDTYAYVLYYIKTFTALSAGSDTPSLPDDFEAALVTRATAYGYRDLQMPDEFAAWWNASEAQVAGLRQQYFKEVEDWNRGLRLEIRRRTR